MPHSLETLGLKIPHIYLPENTRALDTWCVIACDQYTSDPAYWENVERTVGDQPSTLKMVLPEVYLGTESSRRVWKKPTAPCSVIWTAAFSASCRAAVS